MARYFNKKCICFDSSLYAKSRFTVTLTGLIPTINFSIQDLTHVGETSIFLTSFPGFLVQILDSRNTPTI